MKLRLSGAVSTSCRRVMIALGVALFVASQASASLVVYTDRASWETAIGGSDGLKNFNSVTPFTMAAGINSAGLIDIEIFGPPTSNRIDDGTSFSNFDGSNYYNGKVDSAGTTQASILSPTISGFGADWVSATSAGGLTLTIGSDSVVFGDFLTGTGDGFLGVVSSVAFSTMALNSATGGTEQFGMDNYTFKTTAVVPIPATAWLFGSGLIGLAGIARRRKVTG